MIKDKKKDALKALEQCDEFYLLTYKDGEKAGHWNFEDYAKVIGCLEVAKEWFKKQVMKCIKL